MSAVAIAPTVTVDRLRPALKARGMTQASVAKRLGVSHVDVCRALAFADPGGLLTRIAETVFDATAASNEPK